MNRIRGHGRGKWVCSAKDFADIGSRAAIDQALSRLARSGKLRRVSRGLYDLPQQNPLLKGPSPTRTDAAIKALSRRSAAMVAMDNIVAANGIGLTNAVPTKPTYITDGAARTILIGDRPIRLKRASTYLRPWRGNVARPVVQALLWLGKDLASTDSTIKHLRTNLPSGVKKALASGKDQLPWWAMNVVDKVTDEDTRVSKVSGRA